MELPPHLKFQGILKQGHAFKAEVQRDKYSRYYFVLNIDPQTDTALVLFTSTTKFEDHRNCVGGDNVHIVLSKEDYSEFEESCLICCDRPIVINKTKLENSLGKQHYRLLQPLPLPVLNKLLQGVLNSPVVAGDVKKMVLGSGD